MAGFEEYLESLVEPKSLQEIQTDLQTSSFSSNLGEILDEAVQNGKVERKLLPGGCKMYMSRGDYYCYSIPVLSRVNLPFRSPVVKSPSNDETCHTPVCDLSSSAAVSDFRNVSETPRSRLQSHSSADKTLNHLEQCRNIEKEIFDLDQEIHNLSQTYNEDELEMHIKALHDYNEIKDIGQILLGKIAEAENTTTTSLYSRFRLELDD